MHTAYLITPFITWFIAGLLKFIIISISKRKIDFNLIGYGGLPSNHSAIVSSTTALIALREGIGHPAFGVALTLSFIVILDANSLRREIGKHAAAINRISADDTQMLRERMGHSKTEIFAGILVGTCVAVIVNGMQI
jgi:uncharacterized protein